MTEEDKSFDELIRGKLESRSFEFNEAGWQKAEKLVNASKAGKATGAGAWGKIATIALTAVAASGITLLAVHFTGEKKSATENASQTNGMTNAPVSSLTQNEQSQPNAATNTSASIASQQNSSTENNAVQNGNAVDAANSSRTNSQTPVTGSGNGQNNSFAKGLTSSATNSSASQPTAQTAASVKSQKTTHPKTSRHLVSQNSTATSSNNSGTLTVQNHSQQSTQNSIAVNETQNGNAQQDDHSNAIQPIASGNKNENNVNAATQNQQQAQQSHSATAQSNTGNNSNVNAGINAANENAPATLMAATTETQNTIAAQQDSTPTQQQGRDEGVRHPAPPVNFFFAEAGAAFIPGHGFSPVIGAGYQLRIAGRFSLQTGLQYSMVNNVAGDPTTFNNPTYSFGMQNNLSEVTMKRLYYFSVPVSLAWHVYGRHSITAGVMGNYLSTTESRVRTYMDSGIATENDQTKTIFGFKQGISRFDGLVTAGYSCGFGIHWNAQLTGYYGLTTLKSTMYNINTFSRNRGIRLTLQYAF